MDQNSERALLAFDDDARNVLWSVSAFFVSPDGDAQSRVLPGVDFSTFLIDGDNGKAVFLDDDSSEPLETLPVLDLASGELEERPLDFSEQLGSGQRAVAQGIAVRGNMAFVSGGIFDDVCRAQPGCFREPRYAEAIACFMARINIDTGAILDYRPYTVEQRPSDGIGQFTGDSVVFSDSQPLTRHSDK